MSNAATGAGYGYSLLWALALAVLFRLLWLDLSARYVLATGESLMEGYQRLGSWVLWLVAAAMLVIRSLSNVYKLVLLGEITHAWLPGTLPVAGWGTVYATACYAFCRYGGYPQMERWFRLLMAVMGGGFLIAVILSQPSASAIVQGLLIPSIPEDKGVYGVMLLLIALVGTEAGSLTNVTYSYFIWSKGWRDPSFRPRQRMDLRFSVICIFAMGAMVQMTAAGSFQGQPSPESAQDLVMLFANALGAPGLVIFAFGIWAAAMSGLIAATSGYALVGTDVLSRLRGGKPKPADSNDAHRGFAHRMLLLFWFGAPVLMLAMEHRPVKLALLVSALMGALIPVMAIILLFLVSDRKRMGSLQARGWEMAGLGILALASGTLLAMNVKGWWS